MNTNKSIALAIALAALATSNAFAATGTWTGSSGATWDSSATNWTGVTGSPWTDYSNTAQFDTSGNVNVSGVVKIGNLLYTPTSGILAISGGSQLWLNNNTGDLSVATGGTVSITSPIVGAPISIGNAGAGYAGTVIFGGTPIYFDGGTFNLVNGRVRLITSGAIGNAANIYTQGYGNHSTLELSGGITVGSGNTLWAGGVGLNSTGQLNVSDGTTNTWTGAIRANGLTTIGVSGAANGRLNLTGNITQANSPTLQLMSQASNSTISVTGTITLDSSSALRIIAAGASGGVTRLGSTGNTLGLLKVDVHGDLVADVANAFDSAAVLQLGSAGDTVTVEGAVDLNGYSQTVGGLRSGNSAAGETLSGGTRSITSASAATLTVNQTTSALYDGTITGAVALTKQGAGNLTLSGTNTYTGATTITAGTLVLASTGSIANSSEVNLGTVGKLDVSAVSGFSIASGQTLKGSGTVTGNITMANGSTLAIGNSPGTVTFDNNLSLGSTSISNFEINGLTAGLYDLAQGGAGSQTVNFGGTLNLTFQAGFATEGSVKVFDFETYAGSFTAVNTPGLASGYSATFNASNGMVTVVPEPSTWALLALGLTTVVLRRRRTS